MLERMRYRSVRKAAENALEVIWPQVPIANGDIESQKRPPPDHLKGWLGLKVGSDGTNLEHKTPKGEKSHVYTRVQKRGSELIVLEAYATDKWRATSTIEFKDGKFVRATRREPYAPSEQKGTTKAARRRIKKTLRA